MSVVEKGKIYLFYDLSTLLHQNIFLNKREKPEMAFLQILLYTSGSHNIGNPDILVFLSKQGGKILDSHHRKSSAFNYSPKTEKKRESKQLFIIILLMSAINTNSINCTTIDDCKRNTNCDLDVQQLSPNKTII